MKAPYDICIPQHTRYYVLLNILLLLMVNTINSEHPFTT